MEFGVGIYLYIELFRRLAYVFLFLTLVETTRIVFNILGTGFSIYSPSFSTYTIRATLGNYNAAVTEYDVYVQTGLHCLAALAFFVFVVSWKVQSYKKRKEFERDNNIIHPKKYCVEVEGLPKFGVRAE